ncbi:MAG: DUF5696 domain-containing protein, partial [Saccharofermentanales bacterium]
LNSFVFKISLFVILMAGIILTAISCTSSYGHEWGGHTIPDAAEEINGEGWQTVGSNDRFTLEADAANGWIRISDRDGRAWNNFPDGYEEDPIARNSFKMDMESVLMLHYSDQLNNIDTINSRNASVNKGGLKCFRLRNGIRMTFSFPKEGFAVSVDLTLGDEYLRAEIPFGLIQESDVKYSIVSMSLLPFLGSAPEDDDGYIFVPDGSGALIYLNRSGRSRDDYSQSVYGREPAVVRLKQDSEEMTVRLPVFGIKYRNNAVMAVITENAGRALVKASVSGKRSSFNNVYSSFIFRDSEMTTIKKTGQTVRVIEAYPDRNEVFGVSYYFLNNKEANYTGMANLYGRSVFKDKKTNDNDKGSVPLYLQFFGGIYLDESYAGFPVKRVVPLADFDDVENIVRDLSETGISDMSVHYFHWNRGADFNMIPVGVDPEGRLGGSKGFRQLISYLNDTGTAFYPEFDFINIGRSRIGYRIGYHSVTSITGDPAHKYTYWPNSLQAKLTQPSYLLKWDRVISAVAKASNEIQKYSFTGIGASTLGSSTYSDFSRNGYSRQVSEIIASEQLEMLKAASESLLLSAPYGYALENCDVAVDTPLFSSGFNVEDETIPFYQIAMHPYIRMSTPNINSLSDPDKGTLKALESGIGLQYGVITQNPERANESAVYQTRGLYADDGLNEPASEYLNLKPVIDHVDRSKIIEHTCGPDGLRKTVFEDKSVIWVNYGTEDQVTEDGIVKAKGYLFVRSEG